jgi:hypothetical protein
LQNPPLSVQQLTDRLELHDLVMRYARALDRGDFEMLASVFHDDATLNFGSYFKGPVKGFIDAAKASTAITGFEMGMHTMPNALFVIDGDVAEGETYSVTYLRWGPPRMQQLAVGARYLDRYERRSGVWRIASRTQVLDWKSELPLVPPDRDPLGKLDLLGRTDRGDMSFTLATLSKPLDD